MRLFELDFLKLLLVIEHEEELGGGLMRSEMADFKLMISINRVFLVNTSKLICFKTYPLI